MIIKFEAIETRGAQRGARRPVWVRASASVLALAWSFALMGGRAEAKQPAATQPAASQAPSQPTPAELQKQIDELQQQLNNLNKDTRVLQVKDEERDKAKPIAGYQDGFFIQSPDGKTFKLKVGGYAQADARLYTEEKGSSNTDQFTMRRVRLDIRGTLAERFEFRLLPDFAGSSLVLQDAYLDSKFSPYSVVRTGKFKTPFGIERLQSATALQFIERGLPNNLVPNRDLGLQLYGDYGLGQMTYQLALVNGVPDGGSGDTDINDPFDFAGRVFGQPFLNTALAPLRGLGVGVAGTYGIEHGTLSNTQLSSYKTASQATFFRYATDNPATGAGTTIADGTHWRVSPQAYYYWGPFSALGEVVRSSQKISRTGIDTTADNYSWQLRAGWVLSGENASYKGVIPANNFNFGGGSWGAWELAVRYEALNVDDDVFDNGFASINSSANEARAVGTALNWYLNKNIAFQVDFEHTTFDGGRAGGQDRRDENVFLTRTQFVF